MPKRKLLQIGNITSRMADRLEPEFDIIEYFKSQNKEWVPEDKKLLERKRTRNFLVFIL